MAPFEYLLLFASVVLGLALAELAVGVNRLLRDWDKVRWDWLAPMAAALAFLKIVTQWWTWHSVEKFAAGLTYEMFLFVLIGTMLVFLIAATPLPEVTEDGVDLRKHWDKVSRRYWALFLVHWVLQTGVVLWVQIVTMHRTFRSSPFWRRNSRTTGSTLRSYVSAGISSVVGRSSSRIRPFGTCRFSA